MKHLLAPSSFSAHTPVDTKNLAVFGGPASWSKFVKPVSSLAEASNIAPVLCLGEASQP